MGHWQLKQLQSLPLEVKVQKSLLRIKEWYEYYNGEVYVSFSGGKDSTVLLHLVRSLYPDVEAVFSDTGLEFPEIREFIKGVENVTWLKPKMNFKDVIKKYGYPVISKEVSEAVHGTRKGYPSMIKKLTDKERKFNCTKYQYLLDAPFKISHYCCNIMKKNPLKQYENKSKKNPIVGTMAGESQQREKSYIKNGCNSFEATRPISQPISFWNEDDIWEYIKQNNIQYSKIYDMGYTRTGCMFCMFGVHLEKGENRFQLRYKTHPEIWEYCMKDMGDGGLGLQKVLNFINVPSKNKFEQLSMFDKE